MGKKREQKWDTQEEKHGMIVWHEGKLIKRAPQDVMAIRSLTIAQGNSLAKKQHLEY